jgi:hypothetical protein
LRSKPTGPSGYYGFDSARVVEMVGDFGAWLGRRLPPTFFWDYPTIEQVARHIGSETVIDLPARATESAEPIAIVGMACRFPGAENHRGFLAVAARRG